ncbi:hypothetical protein LTR46_012040, partial [Exophiala xenobiotica]
MAGDFIGEYTGEIISINEGDRRGAMYHVLKQEYLFTINKGQEIDASNHGNKMRFMNNSQLDEYINVEPKKLWCNGVVRLGLFAKRSIKAGEELLYNYNYPESVTKNFWEPGEGPAVARRRLTPPAAERIPRPAGANKLTEAPTNQIPEGRSRPLLWARHPKRKWPVEDRRTVPYRTKHAPLFDVSGGSSAEERAQAPEAPETPHTGDSEDSEYESNSQFSVDEDEVDEESDDEPDDDPDDKPEAESIERLPTRARDYALRRGSQYVQETTRSRTRTEKERSTSRRDKGASQPFEEKTGRAGTVQMVK